MTYPRTLTPLTLIATSALLLSACAGEAGDTEGGADEGFEYGVEQEELNSVLADLEPVEITYQAGAQSQNSISAANDLAFKEYVEERSNGQISVDIVWGQAIAGYPELEDALVDGRVDVAYAVPIYKPNEYPTFDAIGSATSGLPNSPVVGEMVGDAAVIELASSSEELRAEYEAQGVTPLLPMISTGTYLSVCAEPGTAPEDWTGRTVRVGNSAHEQQAQSLGGTPTSMAYTEVFEALQRGTVDCTLAQFRPSEEAGLLEAAPYVAYTSEENSLSGRAAGAVLAGSKYQQLPLAYQQIIYDANEVRFVTNNEVAATSNAAGVAQLKGAGGEIGPLDEEADQILGETNDELLADVEESGHVPPGIADRVSEAGERWSEVAEELGYSEAGGFEDLDEWYEPADYDYAPMAERVFKDVLLEHRPE
jgi:TRAP-type C4-dicarboxylate transport system substrate-binding protein